MLIKIKIVTHISYVLYLMLEFKSYVNFVHVKDTRKLFYIIYFIVKTTGNQYLIMNEGFITGLGIF